MTWDRLALTGAIFGSSRTLADLRRAWGCGPREPLYLRVGDEVMRIRRIIDSATCWVERGG